MPRIEGSAGRIMAIEERKIAADEQQLASISYTIHNQVISSHGPAFGQSPRYYYYKLHMVSNHGKYQQEAICK